MQSSGATSCAERQEPSLGFARGCSICNDAQRADAQNQQAAREAIDHAISLSFKAQHAHYSTIFGVCLVFARNTGPASHLRNLPFQDKSRMRFLILPKPAFSIMSICE